MPELWVQAGTVSGEGCRQELWVWAQSAHGSTSTGSPQKLWVQAQGAAVGIGTVPAGAVGIGGHCKGTSQHSFC